MKERQLKFIELLLQNEQYVPSHIFSDKLHISEKTLHRDIIKINQELKPLHAFIEKKTGIGIRINIENTNKKIFYEKIIQKMKNSDKNQKVSWNKDYRRMDIALNFLLYTDEKILLSDLSYKYFVSRSSIVNDIQAVEKSFFSYNISFKKENGRFYIEGREEDIRTALTDLIETLLNHSLENENHKNSETDIMMTILDCFSEADLSNTEHILREFEEDENYYFDEHEYGRISISILVMVYRIRQGFIFSDNKNEITTTEDKLYKTTRKLIKKISDLFDIKISNSESMVIYQILLETHFSYKVFQKVDEYRQELAKFFVDDFIDAFSIIMELNIREEFSLYQNIMSHISLMVTRVVQNNQARNPLVSQIKEEYKEVTKICQIICWILEKKFSLPEISIDEICYLALYIQGEIMEQEENADVLLVSNHAKGIINLLRHKLLTKHSKWKIDECSYYDFYMKDIEQYDFIISTQNLEGKNRNIPYVHISPVITESDWNIIDKLFHYVKETSMWYLQKLAGTVTDLKDIGCKIEIVQEELPIILNRDSIRIEGLKEINYLYTFQKGEENICRFFIDKDGKKIRSLRFEMGNWDYMLFASKLFYYLGSCSDEVIEKFVIILLQEGRNMDV